jgi:NAD(P)-dependent dehydrogenase (short-subunit alcohol dehydrogenase family)
MSAGTPAAVQREPELAGQTVVVIGGSAGIGLETARRARAEGAEVILTGRDPVRLSQAAKEVGAQRTAAFDANDTACLQRFFQDLPAPIDHVMVTAGGPVYGPLLEMEPAQVRNALSDHIVLGLEVARNAAGKMRPGGTLVLMGGTGGRRVGHGLGIASAATAALPPFAAALALELAPVRVNLIAVGFVDTPLSASLLGDQLEERRSELRATPDKPGITVANYEPGGTTSIFLNLRVADIQARYEEWKSKGAEFLTPPIDREAEIRCYMRDPDGYLIEVGQATGILHGIQAKKRPEDLPTAGSGRHQGLRSCSFSTLRGGMDNWDPAVTDGLASGRPVILFDNAGVASSSGQTPETMEVFADHAAAFAGALGLTQVDVLGFSIGGHAAQALALRHLRLVRRLVIIGSRPRAGVDEGSTGCPRGREPTRGDDAGGLPVPVLRADAEQRGSGPRILAAAPSPHGS